MPDRFDDQDPNSLFDFAEWGGRPRPKYQRDLRNPPLAALQKRAGVRPVGEPISKRRPGSLLSILDQMRALGDALPPR